MSEISKKPIQFEGCMLLEGPFLEQIIAGYLLKNGMEIVPRFETGGIQHDILIKRSDGYILYECTGQREITEGKIDKFHFDTLRLHDVLVKLEGKGITEAIFAAAVNDDAWDPYVKNLIAKVEESLKKRIGADLHIISGLGLIEKLIKSGILGLRLVKGKLHFAGPEDYAIRYNSNEKEFKMSFAPFNSIEFSRFRDLPHSFLPSYYWESHYKDLYLESFEEKGKVEPLTIWSYYYEEGVKWSNTKDIVESFYHYLNLLPRTYMIEEGDDYLIEESKSRRGNRYYAVHMFSNNTKFDSSVAGELMGKAIRLIDKIKTRGSYLERESFSIYIHSATEDWSFKAWENLKKIPETLIRDISIIIPERGNELLLKLLNMGVLGLRFRTKNEITLSGPEVEAVRVSKTDSGKDITISKEPYRLW